MWHGKKLQEINQNVSKNQGERFVGLQLFTTDTIRRAPTLILRTTGPAAGLNPPPPFEICNAEAEASWSA